MSECPPCSEIMIVAAPGRSLHRVRDWAVQMSKQVLEAAARARPRLPAERCGRHRSMPDASKPLLLVPASRFLFMLRFHLNVTNISAAQRKIVARFGYGLLGGDLG